MKVGAHSTPTATISGPAPPMPMRCSYLRVQWVYQLSHSLGSCQLEGIVTCARAAEQMSVGPAAGQAIRHRMFCLPCHMVTPLGLGTSLQSSSNSSFPHTCGAQCLHSHAKAKHAIKLSTSSAYMARPHT